MQYLLTLRASGLEPISEEVAKETMAMEVVAELSILQEQKLLACLETSRHIERCNDKARNPFGGSSKESKKRARKRSQQMRMEMVSSIGLDDRAEVAVDMSTWTADGVGFGQYWAWLKELSARNEAVEFVKFCEEDMGGDGLWHHPCLIT